VASDFATRTNLSFNEEIIMTYCFGNEQAKADFMKDPTNGNLAKAQPYYSTKHPG
jgi:hypothetical protein